MAASVAPVSGGGPTLHTTTYNPGDTLATWPASTSLMLHGIGGPRTSVTTGWTETSFPDEPGLLWGGYLPIPDGTYYLPCTVTGYPHNTDLTGSNLSGVTLTVSFAGGFFASQENPGGLPIYFNASSDSGYPINSITANMGGVVGNYSGIFQTSNGTASGFGGQGPSYNLAIPSYSDGPSASLVVNSVSKTFAGQTAGGSNTYTDYTVNSGATTSGALSIPTGGQITVSYYA